MGKFILKSASMITSTTTPEMIQKDAQWHAAIGYLHCLSHEKLFNQKLTSTFVVNFLFTAAIPFTKTMPIIIPIVLCTGTVLFLAYNVTCLKDRYMAQKEAIRWKSTFELVLNGKYEEAYKRYRENGAWIANHFFQDSFQKCKPEAAFYARISLYNLFNFAPIHLQKHADKFFVNFEFSMAIIKAIAPCAEKDYEDIKRPIPYLRAPQPGEEEKAIEFVKRAETFHPTQVDNFAKFLYDDLVKRLNKLETEPPSPQSDIVIERDAKSYMQLLLDYGTGLSVKEREALGRLLACKYIIEMIQLGSSLFSQV